MTTETDSSESTRRKRQRRVKQDPQFVFENSTVAEKEIERKSVISVKPKAKPVKPTNEPAVGEDLYEPGDLVWSKLGSFPWWPALIYRCEAEGGSHTRTFNSNNQSKRQFYVYFYGKYLEYSWLSTRSLLPYAGLNNFIQHAEAAVEKASTKSEQVHLANRFQLKVSMKKRIQWDEAIELADHALTLSNAERIEEFSSLLSDTRNQTKRGIRRQQRPEDKNQEDLASPKTSASLTASSDELTSKNIGDTEQKPSRKRKPPTSNPEKTANPSTKNDSDVEYEYIPVIKGPTNSAISPPQLHFLQMNIPPLSNYEQKQLVEGLLNHPQEKSLTFDEARTFATNKAIEIIHENYNYRMNQLSNEWFYDFILLRHPSVVFKYRSWFEHIPTNVIPDGTDPIPLKQWLIALMLEAEQKSSINDGQ